jgi:hypothetical protein
MPRLFDADTTLKKQADKLFDASIEQSTAITYQTGMDCFVTFLVMSRLCSGFNRLPSINEDMLVYFVTHCQLRLKLSYQTIKTYLAGIRFFFVRNGHNLIFRNFQKLHGVLKGIKKHQCNNKRELRQPITFFILSKICLNLNRGIFSPLLDMMFKCICQMAFFGFMRCGEFTVRKKTQDTYISMFDITFSDDGSFYIITLKTSKTDPFRQGVNIKIFENEFLKPVANMKMYYNKRRTLDTSNHTALFIDSEGHPLSRDVFLSHFKFILSRIGLNDKNYSGHSFRIGAATSAAKVGIPDHLIQSLGRWSSDCYMRYIRID